MPDPVTGIMGAASAASAGANIMGARSAADRQTAAGERSIAAMMEMFEELKSMRNDVVSRAGTNLNPFINTGRQATTTLSEALPDLAAPIELTQEWLESTPGYKFIKDQGLRAVTNQNVLRGLSGAQLKGAADWVTGLADQTYKTQFDIANINKTNAFNRLFQTAESGKGAAADLSRIDSSITAPLIAAGTQTGANVGGTMVGIGNAQAGADIATGQAIGQFMGNLPFTPYMANRLYPGGMPGGGAAAGGMYQGNPWTPGGAGDPSSWGN